MNAQNETNRTVDRRSRIAARLLLLLAAAGLIAATFALSAGLQAGANPANDRFATLAAQADAPPPIAVELLTGRAVFTDALVLDLAYQPSDTELIEMKLTEPSRTVVAKITVQPGARFPWHTHPGPVFVNVAEGELVYVPASDCTGRHYPVGTAFIDPGRGYVHTAYNPTEGVTVVFATFFEVPESGPLTMTEGVTEPSDCQVEVGPHTSH